MECVIKSPLAHILRSQLKKEYLNPLNAKFTKWSNTLKHFFNQLPENFLSVFDHFVGLVLKGLIVAHNLISRYSSNTLLVLKNS